MRTKPISYKILSYTDEKTRQLKDFLFSAFLKDSYSEQNLKNLNIIGRGL